MERNVVIVFIVDIELVGIAREIELDVVDAPCVALAVVVVGIVVFGKRVFVELPVFLFVETRVLVGPTGVKVPPCDEVLGRARRGWPSVFDRFLHHCVDDVCLAL